MAIVKLGAIITDASGKVGGHVIGKNRGNHVLKNKSVSNKNGSTAQSKQRSITQLIMSYWSKLSDDVRRSYYESQSYYLSNNKFGDVVKSSGFLIFQKLSQGLHVQGLALSTSSVVLHKPSIPDNLQIDASTTQLLVSSNNMSSDTNVVIWVIPNVKNGVKRPKKKRFKLGIYSGTQLNSGLNLFSVYNSVVGPMNENENLLFISKTYSSLSGYSNGVAVIQRINVNAPAQINLITNGNFDDGLTGWVPPRNNAALTVVNGWGRSTTIASASNGIAHVATLLEIGKNYRISFDYSTLNTNSDYTVRLSSNQNMGGALNNLGTIFRSSSGVFTADFTAAAITNYFGVIHFGGATVSDYLEIDNVILVEL